MSTTTRSVPALPFQPLSMSLAQLAAVSFQARYSGATHVLYSAQLGRWFAWCQTNGLDPLVGIQRAHVELYTRQLGEAGLMDSTVNTMMHAVRGYFRFADIDGSSQPTRPCTPGSRRSTGTSPEPRAWTGWS